MIMTVGGGVNESSMQNSSVCAGSSEDRNSSSDLENSQHLCVFISARSSTHFREQLAQDLQLVLH